MTNRYTTINSRITVLMEKDVIFSEYATHIEIADESGGPFLQDERAADRHPDRQDGTGCVRQPQGVHAEVHGRTESSRES